MSWGSGSSHEWMPNTWSGKGWQDSSWISYGGKPSWPEYDGKGYHNDEKGWKGSYYGKSGKGGGSKGVTINIGDSLLHALTGARQAGMNVFPEEVPQLPCFPGLGGSPAPAPSAPAASRSNAEDARRREGKVKRKKKDGRQSKARSPSTNSSSESSEGTPLRRRSSSPRRGRRSIPGEKTEKSKKSHNPQKNIKRSASPDQRRHTRQRGSSVPEPGTPQRGRVPLHHSTPPPARDDQELQNLRASLEVARMQAEIWKGLASAIPRMPLTPVAAVQGARSPHTPLSLLPAAAAPAAAREALAVAAASLMDEEMNEEGASRPANAPTPVLPSGASALGDKPSREMRALAQNLLGSAAQVGPTASWASLRRQFVGLPEPQLHVLLNRTQAREGMVSREEWADHLLQWIKDQHH